MPLAGAVFLSAILLGILLLSILGLWWRRESWLILSGGLALLNCGLAIPWGFLVTVDASCPKLTRVWGCGLTVIAPLMFGVLVATSLLWY